MYHRQTTPSRCTIETSSDQKGQLSCENADQTMRSAAAKIGARRCAASPMTVAGVNADRSTPCQ